MEKQPSLRERNRLRTRSDILDAASEILSEGGFADLALEDVSQRAGLSRGTVYAHFPGGRDEVVREAYLRVADAVYVRGITLREEARDVAGRITALARAYVEVTSSPAGRFYGVMGPDVVPVLAGVRRTSKSFEALIRMDLSAAGAAGQLEEGPDIDALATALSGAIRAAGSQAAAEPGRAEHQVAAIGLLAHGLLSLHEG